MTDRFWALNFASGSASIIFAVQADTTGSTFDIKAMLIGNAQVDVLGGEDQRRCKT
jgi:hypothetical protein